jgi:hypothetical protein
LIPQAIEGFREIIGSERVLHEAEPSEMPDGFDRAEWLWSYIAARISDPAGDWHFRVGPDGAPDPTMPKVGPWKEPYHQGRACLELIERARRRANEAVEAAVTSNIESANR